MQKDWGNPECSRILSLGFTPKNINQSHEAVHIVEIRPFALAYVQTRSLAPCQWLKSSVYYTISPFAEVSIYK